MKNCPDDLISNLKEEYDLYFEDTELDYLNSSVEIIEALIRSTVIEKCSGKKVIICGAGKETERLLENLEAYTNKNYFEIIGIADKDTTRNEFMGFPICGWDEIVSRECDVLVISSFKYRNEMVREISELGVSCSVLDVYNELALNGFFFDAPYWHKQDLRLFYLKIWFIRRCYEEATDSHEKEVYLRKLISSYLNIRDFVYCYKYLDEYKKKYGNSLVEFEVKIRQIVTSVIKEINGGTNNHIITFWVDQLRYCDLGNMPFLNGFGKNNIIFERAYTQNLQTSTTFKMMFSGRDVIDEKAYEIDKINKDNSCVYKRLSEKGYDFKYIGWGKNNVYFDGISSYTLEKDNCILPLNIWKAISDIYLSNDTKPVFYLLHSFESHEHHYCGYMTEALYDIHNATFDEFETRYYECIKYIDDELHFYLPLFGSKYSLIVMSDHGQELENVYLFDEDNNFSNQKFKHGRWSENSLHTVMIVKSDYFGKMEVKSLFSLVQFDQLVDSLLENRWNVEKREYIKIQSMPFYALAGIEKIKKANDYKFGMLVKGIVKGELKYLIYADGTEEVYKVGDDSLNVIGVVGEETLDELRKICGDIDYSIFDNPKYLNARKLLEEYRKEFL